MYDQLYEFLNRDFTNDIDELKVSIKRHARLATSDLIHLSEIPIYSQGDCIAMFGINPAYRPNKEFRN